MTGSASQFVGDVPGIYDRNLGPNIFQDYAADIAARAAALKPSNVLELAAGTGIVSRRLRDLLPAEAKLTVTDLNAPMLEVARGKFRPGENVEFGTADAMSLPFANGQFDLIVCQFGVMFFPDKQASFREALRVLRPGSAYLFNTWGTWAENPFARIAHEAVAEMFPDDPPGFYRVPFSYADAAAATADLKAAGFANVTHDDAPRSKQVSDLGAFAHGLVRGNPLIDEISKRPGADPARLIATIETRMRAAWGNEPAIMALKANFFLARRT